MLRGLGPELGGLWRGMMDVRVESQIDADSPNIKCCHCDMVELSVATLQHLVDAAHRERYCDSALQRSLKRDAHFIWCSKCPGGGWVDPSQPTSKCGWNCPLCDNSFVYCPLCRRSCVVSLAGTMVASAASASIGCAKRPWLLTALVAFEDGGCNYMDCPNCRRHFCWSCG
ncbi:RNF14 [Symbiodinium natans]|uniref:RNF14 protein n=1 Tax=Symbiodinium natans TaxID=878477 RepID=A0A812MVG7_9DINO|nr:RNF14 [Symbiodinium natans]